MSNDRHNKNEELNYRDKKETKKILATFAILAVLGISVLIAKSQGSHYHYSPETKVVVAKKYQGLESIIVDEMGGYNDTYNLKIIAKDVKNMDQNKEVFEDDKIDVGEGVTIYEEIEPR